MHRRLFAILAFSVICLMGLTILPCKAPAEQPRAPLETPPSKDDKSPAGNAKTEDNSAAIVLNRVHELHGAVEFDAQGKPIGIDLLDRQASDEDVKIFTLLPGIRKISLWGVKITDQAPRSLPPFRSSSN